MTRPSALVSFKAPPDPAATLFCLPYAGAGASVYRPFAQGLPQVAVVGVQPPGRENRLGAPFAPDLLTLAAELAAAIAAQAGEAPYAVFGHSLGALVAYETVRALRRTGKPLPRLLVVSGARAPEVVRAPYGPFDDAGLRARLVSLGGTPAAVLDHPELMAMVGPIVRADFALIDGYAYREEAPLPLPLLALGGLVDPEVSRPDLEAWRGHATGRTSVALFPGGHFFIQSERDTVLATLSRALADALAPP